MYVGNKDNINSNLILCLLDYMKIKRKVNKEHAPTQKLPVVSINATTNMSIVKPLTGGVRLDRQHVSDNNREASCHQSQPARG